MQEDNSHNSDYDPATSGQAQGRPNYRYDYEGEKLTNDPAALTIAIISLVLYFMGCICYGLPAILTLAGSIVAWVMADKALKLYQTDPSRFSRNTYKSVNAAKIVGIIGTFLSGITVLIWLVIMIFFGAIFSEALEGDFDLNEWENRELQDMESDEDDDLYETTDDDWEYEEDSEVIEETEETIDYQESAVDSM